MRLAAAAGVDEPWNLTSESAQRCIVSRMRELQGEIERRESELQAARRLSRRGSIQARTTPVDRN